MVLCPGGVDLIEIGEVDLFLYLSYLFLALMLAVVEHAVHEEVHILIQIGGIEIYFFFLAL